MWQYIKGVFIRSYSLDGDNNSWRDIETPSSFDKEIRSLPQNTSFRRFGDTPTPKGFTESEDSSSTENSGCKIQTPPPTLPRKIKTPISILKAHNQRYFEENSHHLKVSFCTF